MSLFGPPNIGKLSAKKNVAGLIKALAWQPQEDIRAGAARALGQIGDPQAVMPLTVTLRDPECGRCVWRRPKRSPRSPTCAPWIT